jgi:hypothetical protein
MSANRATSGITQECSFDRLVPIFLENAPDTLAAAEIPYGEAFAQVGTLALSIAIQVPAQHVVSGTDWTTRRM